MWERNVTPASLTRLRAARLKTWKPPESVRIGPSQPMNRCKPPAPATTFSPGRRARWNVLARIIRVPVARSWSGVIPLTVACVPTGMNAGVSIVPWGVSSKPVRAAEPGSRAVRWKRSGDRGRAAS